MNLFIIGNGFDLHHGLVTSYKDFVNYLENNFENVYLGFVKLMNKYSVEYFRTDITSKSYNWSELEYMMGAIECGELLVEHMDWNVPTSVNEEIKNMLEFGMMLVTI